jgi:hypothetical protein
MCRTTNHAIEFGSRPGDGVCALRLPKAHSDIFWNYCRTVGPYFHPVEPIKLSLLAFSHFIVGLLIRISNRPSRAPNRATPLPIVKPTPACAGAGSHVFIARRTNGRCFGVRLRAFSVPMESERKLYILVLTHFLHANRRPLRSKML